MATERKIKILAVVGPTASGKTAVSIELAKRLGGEVVSCDSMQVYRRMNIGTAKPTKEEMSGIPHYLIDAVEPDEPFSCAEYVTLATEVVREISARGKLPVFCGGTGLYLDRFLCVLSARLRSMSKQVFRRVNSIAVRRWWNRLMRQS